MLGGIGNIRGALLGGLLLGLLEKYGATVFGGEWKDVFAFVVLVLVLLVRPSGLLGETLGTGPGMSTRRPPPRSRASPSSTRVGRRWDAPAVVGQGARPRSPCWPSSIWYPTHPRPATGRACCSSRSASTSSWPSGLNVVVGLTGMLDLGYVAFFAVGAYTTAKLTADNGTFTAWEVLAPRRASWRWWRG